MAANTANVVDVESALNLDNIRRSLMRMEDSIIFSLIERSQYKVNTDVYEPDCAQLGTFKLHQLKSAGSDGSLGDWFIYQSECLHAQVRRYEHPTEFAFFGPLPEPTLGQPAKRARTSEASQGGLRNKPNILAPVPSEALVNKRLLDIYRKSIVPTICEGGDDGNLGSTAVQDVQVLQTMATRIYYGLFVAESKFRTETDKATALIKAKDREGLMAFITKPEVEHRNIQRVILKARTFSQNIQAGTEGQLTPTLSRDTTYKLDAEYMGKVFRDFLMPLTKDVEVDYLLARLDHGVEPGTPSKTA